MQKKCQSCGKTFTAGQGNYKYCESCKAEMTPPAPKHEAIIVKNAIAGQSAEAIADRVEKVVNSKMEAVGAKIAHTEEVDMVNHPPHYKLANGMESIDVIRAVLTPEEYKGWCKGNALKYQFRAGKKDPAKESEDYRKAEFFLKELSNGDEVF